jgi:parallel beta-helix repeat protein
MGTRITMSQIAEKLKFIAIVCFVLLVWLGCASAATLVVNQTAPANTSGDCYYGTIKEAVAMAKEGDTIVVCPGTYKENIEVEKSITILSLDGADSTTVLANDSKDHAFEVTANYVTIDGFTVEGVTGGYTSGIYIYCADYCDLSNNNCSNNSLGIYLYNSKNNSIFNNTCSNNNDGGIQLENSKNNKLKGNIMIDNGIFISGDLESDYTHEIDECNTVNGMPVYYWKDVEGGRIPDGAGQSILVNCKYVAIENQDLNNATVGIEVAFSSFITIKNNNCSNGWKGIHFFCSNNNSISKNNCTNNRDDGIYLYKSNSNHISKNNCTNNRDDGIYLYKSNSNHIPKNNCTNNRDDGIYLYKSNSNHIPKNNCTNNRDDGIYLYKSNSNSIPKNNCTNNNDEGIHLEDSNGNIVKDNIANSNKQYRGIYLYSSSNNFISYNNASGNFKCGIALFESSDNNTIIGNGANLNNNDGIYIENSCNNSISNNIVKSNKQYHGIHLSSSNNNVIEDNNASNNMGTGISLSKSIGNTIRGNIAINERHGIGLLNSSNNNSIINNTISDNLQCNIALFDSNNNNIRKNTAISSKKYAGILLKSSNKNIIANNIASSNMQNGIELLDSCDNTVKDNIAKSNKQFDGIHLKSSDNNIITDNDVSNNTQRGILLDSSNNNIIRGNMANSNKQYHGITCSESSSNNIIVNNTVSNNNKGCGISFDFLSSNNILKGNIANSNYYGIYLKSSNNILLNNEMTYNFKGLFLSWSNNNAICSNIIYSNIKDGIYLNGQKNNIFNNIINSNGFGISLEVSENNTITNNIISSNQGRGLDLLYAGKTKIMNNFINTNLGAGIYSINSSSITISGNTINSNYVKGIEINATSTSCEVYHNNILNNDIDDYSSNSWYSDSLKEGNYWSDYDGADDGSGTVKHATAGDGIGDTNLPYPEEGYDYYPFINRDGWLTMSVWPQYHDFGKIYQGTKIKNQTFTITNYGNSILNVSSIKYDNATIKIFDMALPLSIAKGSSRSFNVSLDTDNLDGFVLKNMEIITNDLERQHKNISIFGFVQIPTHNIEITGVDYQSRVIKGQINLFNVTINNTGNFREKNVSIEFKAGNRSLGNATIENIESQESMSVIFKWDTTDVAPKTYDILIEVKLKDQLLVDSLHVPVKIDMPSAAQTLIVTNKEKLTDCWGAKRTEKLDNELIKLSYHVGVAGIPIYVEVDEAVAKAYESWDLCLYDPKKANEVAKVIKRLIDDKQEEYTGVKYIVILGDDRIIPYYRIPDNTDKPFGPESWYTEDDYTKLNADSTVGSALQNNMFLTDNIYAVDKAIEWQTAEVNIPELFIPSMPVSRLVENPEEISATIDAYYRKEYVRPDMIFVTAHDFMWDSALYCSSTLEEGMKTRPATIISRNKTEVTRDYFQNVSEWVLNTSNDIVLIFQHAEHDHFSVPKRQERGSPIYQAITAEDIICNSTADMNGSIVYSMSCHAGLNVPPNASTNDLDLVQAFAQKGVVAYIAPTGFGIGSPRTRAAHELLLSYFTRYLCEGMDAGTALMQAKQEYWATNYDFNYFDEQVIETTTLYGLPMVRVNIPHSATSSDEIMIQSSAEEQPDTLVIRPTYTLMSTRDGDYYISTSGELLSDPRKPILPKEVRIFHPTPTRVLRGAVMNTAKYRIEEPFKPLIEYYQKSDLTIELLTGKLRKWFPARIFKINSISYPERPAESRQYLVIITGQYKGAIGPGAIGQERVYDELSFDLYYASPGDEIDLPVIVDVSCAKISGNVTIMANASDESGIRRVLVTYTDSAGAWGKWRSGDLEEKGEGLWSCSISAEEEIEFFVQAVDVYGNVAVDDNKGRYYLT